MFEEVAGAWQRQDYEKAIEVLTRAARLDPGNAGLLLDLGRAHGLRYDPVAARRCFDQAASLASPRGATLAQAGQRCQEFGHYAMARDYFLRAAAEPDVSPAALVTLAELSERHAHLEEAAEWVDRALARDSSHPPAMLARARLARLAGDLEAAEAGIRTLIQRDIRDGWTVIRAWYELGTILDRQGRYDEAMAAVQQAKSRLQPASAGPAALLRGIQARLREMADAIEPAQLRRWAEARDDLTPSHRFAVLCGHPRSGTTLLEQMLDAHPDIITAEETHVLHDEAYLPLSRGFPPESSVFDMLEAATPEALRRSRRDYFRFTESCLGTAIGSRLLVDKNPALSVLLPAVARLFPEARFLVALRDPRDVCLSCFMQPLSLNPVSSAYLTLASTAAQYASVMAFWQALEPHLQNPCLSIRYEEVVDDLPRAGRRVLDFLGLPWHDSITAFHQHARTRPLRSPSYADVTRPIFSRAIGRWQHYEKFLAPATASLKPFLKAFGYD